mgnify:CR=1 FL=1
MSWRASSSPAEPFDVAVLGGGINGAGIARDAAGRGLSVVLFEKDDLGGGTSANSTKLIHGGLRYLEHYEFRLVREALIEREILLGIAPHIIWPLRFVLPHHPGLRPAWLLRLGLFLYDHLGGRKALPATRRIDLTQSPLGAPLSPGHAIGFEYSDCWVEDSRLVLLNAKDAAERGASILPRMAVTSARREGALWHITAEAPHGQPAAFLARTLVNAAGPFVGEVQDGVMGSNQPARLRLVKGSHIVLPRLYDHDRAYIFQNADGRIIFTIPYERDFTLIGTTGQGATDGLRFVQFYFGLPIAMVILGVTIVPFLHGAKVYTAYEFLEKRFDAKTRSLTSFLFLLSRGMSCGTIIAAPSVVLSAIFGWDITWCVALIGIPTVVYTVLGGVQAVTWADVKQMVVIVGALLAIVVVLIMRMPVPLDNALEIAGATGRLRVFDFSFNLSETYTFWSGILGGTFLMLSYFGTDQSQVQRYLAAKSVGEARSSLLMSAYWKIPLQALILLIGVLVFLFYTFTPAPMLFNPQHSAQVQQQEPATFAALEARYSTAITQRTAAAREASADIDNGTKAATTSPKARPGA